jgi:hypothetical protein
MSSEAAGRATGAAASRAMVLPPVLIDRITTKRHSSSVIVSA